jgi:ATP-binding cassette, subfamily B, bacterial
MCLVADPPFLKDVSTLFSSGRWALAMTWRVNRLFLSGIIGCSFVQSLIPLGLAVSARGIVNAVVAGMDAGMDKGPPISHTLYFWLSMGLCFTIAEAVTKFTTRFCTDRLKDELNLQITGDILAHADQLELSRLEDPRFQDVMARASQNTSVNFSNFISSMVSGATNCIQAVSLGVFLVAIDPLIVILMLPVAMPYFVYQWRLSRTRYTLERSRTTKRRWTQYFTGLMTRHEATPEVKLLGLGPLLKNRFEQLLGEFRDQDRKLYQQVFTINLVFAVLSTTIAYAVLLRVTFKVFEGALTVGDVAVFGGAAIRLRVSLEQAILAVARCTEQALYISNLIEFFGIKPERGPTEGICPPVDGGEIDIENVTFRYAGSSQPSVKNVSLHINPGETIAIVGENGAGKSTLVKLIVRLYEPESGDIRFDGHDIRQLSLKHFHRHVSFVFQKFGCYEASVADNIAYGDYDRLISDRDGIEKIAKQSQIDDMITRLPQSYDTLLGRTFGEYTLSGGQWQQIALARAFAREAKLLILDEPTSNLDARTEYNLFLRFKELSEGKTTILISHRFSTVSMAKRIIVMDRGEIVEQGNHRELVARGGYYAQTYKLHKNKMMMNGE